MGTSMITCQWCAQILQALPSLEELTIDTCAPGQCGMVEAAGDHARMRADSGRWPLQLLRLEGGGDMTVNDFLLSELSAISMVVLRAEVVHMSFSCDRLGHDLMWQ